MNINEKLSFIFAMTKHSILHPDCGIEFVKWYFDTKKDKKRSPYQLSNSGMSIRDVIIQLFPNTEIPKHDLSQLDSHCKHFLQQLNSQKYPSKSVPYPTLYSLDNDSAHLLYLICKILKPEKVVETGVAYGRSSSYILQALYENNFGQLHSIDYSFRPWESKQMLGAMIPNYLRDRWNLVYGMSSKKLKSLLDSLGQIDIFIHDSAHTYNNMMLEYSTSWPFIKNNGLLISDDVSNAFYDFSSEKKITPMLISETKDQIFFGILQKSA